MNPAPNLVLVGPMGAGKSSIGRRLATLLGLAFLDADCEIEAQAGASVAARERTVLAELLSGEDRLIATGGGAVLDAANRRAMQARGFVVHLHVDVADQWQRLGRDHTRPLLQASDREEVLRELAQVRDPLYAQVADLRFDTHGMTPADAATRLAQLLGTRWQHLRLPMQGQRT